MINKKPIEVPTPLAKEAKNDKPWSVLLCATPKTAQFVVINGK